MRYETFLPVPPSVNGLFSTNWRTKRRFESEAYERWKKLASKSFKYTGPIYTKRLKAVYKYVFTDKRPRDIENYAKAISDFLVENNVIEDDSLIDHLELIRGEGTIPGVFVQIEVRS